MAVPDFDIISDTTSNSTQDQTTLSRDTSAIEDILARSFPRDAPTAPRHRHDDAPIDGALRRTPWFRSRSRGNQHSDRTSRREMDRALTALKHLESSRIRRGGRSSRRRESLDSNQEPSLDQKSVPDLKLDQDADPRPNTATKANIPRRHSTTNRFLYYPLFVVDFFDYIGRFAFESVIAFFTFIFYSIYLGLNVSAYFILRALKFLIWTIVLGIPRKIIAAILTFAQYLPLTVWQIAGFAMLLLVLRRLLLYFDPENNSRSNMAGIEFIIGKIQIGLTVKKIVDDGWWWRALAAVVAYVGLFEAFLDDIGVFAEMGRLYWVLERWVGWLGESVGWL